MKERGAGENQDILSSELMEDGNAEHLGTRTFIFSYDTKTLILHKVIELFFYVFINEMKAFSLESYWL